jgi:hypothetical protein
VDDSNRRCRREIQGWFWAPAQPDVAAASASSMMRRMVRAQRPHWALQPSPAVRGQPSLAASVPRTSWSVNTLQEQTIMARRPGGNWFDL